MTSGTLAESREDFIARVNRTGIPGYYNPSRGFLADVIESFNQRFFGWAGDPLTAGFARGLAGATHPITIIAHSQGTLTVANAIRYYGLSVDGSTFDMRSPALSRAMASRLIERQGGSMIWRQPYGDIANIYSPSLNPCVGLLGLGTFFVLRVVTEPMDYLEERHD